MEKIMKITTIISLFTVLLVSSAFTGVSSKAHAATYYKCESGYKFQVNGKAARCYKAASKDYTAPLKCKNVTIPAVNRSIGHFLKRDHAGNRDKCVGTFKIGPVTNTNVLDLSCRHGYQLEVRKGKDRCFKTIKAKAVAPTKRVNR